MLSLYDSQARELMEGWSHFHLALFLYPYSAKYLEAVLPNNFCPANCRMLRTHGGSNKSINVLPSANQEEVRGKKTLH